MNEEVFERKVEIKEFERKEIKEEEPKRPTQEEIIKETNKR